MRLESLFFVAMMLACSLLNAQGIRMFNNNVTKVLEAQGNTHNLFKINVVAGLKKGFSIGASYDIWQEHPTFQYSLNTAFMWRFQRSFLLNYKNDTQPNDNRSKSQFVFMFSPMLTVNFSNKEYDYQE